MTLFIGLSPYKLIDCPIYHITHQKNNPKHQSASSTPHHDNPYLITNQSTNSQPPFLNTFVLHNNFHSCYHNPVQFPTSIPKQSSVANTTHYSINILYCKNIVDVIIIYRHIMLCNVRIVC